MDEGQDDDFEDDEDEYTFESGSDSEDEYPYGYVPDNTRWIRDGDFVYAAEDLQDS